MAKKQRRIKTREDAVDSVAGYISHTDGTPEEKAALKQVVFIPEDEPLSLTKAEKIRTTALMFAIQHVEKTICNDAQMYQALKADGRTLVAASVPYVIQGAINFEAFLLGRYSDAKDGARADSDADKHETPAAPTTE